ncbi:MAG TPA: hypothetical protein VJ960_09190, partial [Oceanipulchritudo sp.]|nr:hypothetical protein [Oceanipulchritudo sp.]
MRSRLMKFGRAALLLAGAALILVVLAAVLSPRLIPLALGGYAEKAGLTWESAEAEGYSSITFRGVRYAGEGIDLELDYLKFPQPLPILGKHLMDSGRVELEGGLMEVRMRKAESGRVKPEVGFQPEDLRTIHGIIGDWLPWAP